MSSRLFCDNPIYFFKPSGSLQGCSKLKFPLSSSPAKFLPPLKPFSLEDDLALSSSTISTVVSTARATAFSEQEVPFRPTSPTSLKRSQRQRSGRSVADEASTSTAASKSTDAEPPPAEVEVVGMFGQSVRLKLGQMEIFFEQSPFDAL